MVREWEFPFSDPNWWKTLEHHTEIPVARDNQPQMACYCACGRAFGFYDAYTAHLLAVAREEIKALKKALAEERE